MQHAYCLDGDVYEIGVDEAGRGPMLGRVYAAAVILPLLKSNSNSNSKYNHALMKDSKKFHSEKKIQAAAAYIKENAIAWAVAYASETVIDEINIRNATHRAMHDAITAVIKQASEAAQSASEAAQSASEAAQSANEILLLVDGNDFTPYHINNKRISHVCIEGGDNTYTAIAAASILAKVARDTYIADLCAAQPDLITHYDLLKNKGYGTKKHMDGIKAHGITPLHRKTFGICKTFA